MLRNLLQYFLTIEFAINWYFFAYVTFAASQSCRDPLLQQGFANKALNFDLCTMRVNLHKEINFHEMMKERREGSPIKITGSSKEIKTIS